ncbi:MAG TPA: FG-GAP repeat protein [Burkholderiales bacterium]|nr:FG-GAP repeat protein [Burkholderiales bacterium]
MLYILYNEDRPAGAAYFYTRSTGTWSQQTYVKASNPDTLDNFGTSVALNGDGNTLAVGAQLEDGSSTGIDGSPDNSAANSGAVYLY